jgi:hypothetical protein
VLRHGLPQLKSLEIEQDVLGRYDPKLEGVLWYETSDGQFREEKSRRKGEWDFTTNGYMQSIVRGAPNLEELGLHGNTLTPASLVRARLLIRLDQDRS